ncbi:TonB-dependent receptor [Cephaloticoccus primus]|uniref:TonB-dependent receptor n=1 Tax=Cephaloticoccus primus TaxID=1548207 RepID=UPI0009EEC9DB|nr:TonB-dependent siderophore receptor [Cephaloticoccus primus]
MCKKTALPRPKKKCQAIRYKCLALGLLAAIAATAGPSTVHAQYAPSTADLTTLPDVLVEAEALSGSHSGRQIAAGSRVGMLGSKDAMETPFSTVGYTEQFIADIQAREITDVIAKADPTVFNSGISALSNEAYFLRGFASAPVDAMWGGLFGMAPFYRSSPEMYGSIEVLKGPSALLNGMPPNGSVGGAVNLIPKRAGEQPLNRVSATYLSDSQWGGHVDLGRRFGSTRQFGARVNAMHREGDTAMDHQKRRSRLGSIALDWRGERTRLFADAYASNDYTRGMVRGIYLAPGLALPRPPKPQRLFNAPWSFFDTDDRGVMLRGEWDIGEHVMAYAAAGHSKTTFETTTTARATLINPAGDYTANLVDLGLDMEKKSAQVGLNGRFATGPATHDWALNATYYSDDDDEAVRQNILPTNWVSNIYAPSWAGVAPTDFLANIPLLDRKTRHRSFGIADTVGLAQGRLQLTLGVRRQEVQSDSVSFGVPAHYDSSATTPSAALLYKWSERTSAYANYTEGLSQGSVAPSTAANAGEVFSPARSRQKEIGIKHHWGRWLHSLSLFEIKRPNSYTDPVSAVFSFGGEQRNRGAEWGFFGETPLPGLRLMGGAAYIEPKLTKTAGGINQGRQATGVPKKQAKLGVEWDTPFVAGLTLSTGASAASRQYFNQDNTLHASGRSVYELGARYATTLGGTPLTVRASVANLSNKAYWAVSQWGSLGLGAPRTVMVSASVDL